MERGNKDWADRKRSGCEKRGADMAGVWRDMLPHLSLPLFNTHSNLHGEERAEKLTDKKTNKLTAEERAAVTARQP